MAWAAWVMLRGGATVDPTRPPTALVTSGPYRLSRNPIYLADALILAGLCLLWQPWAAALLVPGFMAVIGHRFIRREEAWLRARDARGFDVGGADPAGWPPVRMPAFQAGVRDNAATAARVLPHPSHTGPMSATPSPASPMPGPRRCALASSDWAPWGSGW